MLYTVCLRPVRCDEQLIDLLLWRFLWRRWHFISYLKQKNFNLTHLQFCWFNLLPIIMRKQYISHRQTSWILISLIKNWYFWKILITSNPSGIEHNEKMTVFRSFSKWDVNWGRELKTGCRVSCHFIAYKICAMRKCYGSRTLFAHVFTMWRAIFDRKVKFPTFILLI